MFVDCLFCFNFGVGVMFVFGFSFLVGLIYSVNALLCLLVMHA